MGRGNTKTQRKTNTHREGGNVAALQSLVLAYHGAASFRLVLTGLIAIVWLLFGFAAALYPSPARETASAPIGIVENLGHGLCLIRGGKLCDYQNSDARLFVSQFAFTSLTLLTLFFAFWRQLLSAIAKALRSFGSGHVVVVGEGLEAETLARNIANKKAKDRRAVVLIRRHASIAEVEALGAVGVALVAGTMSDRSVLSAANVRRAYRVVALSASDAMNLTVAAAAYDLRDYVPGDVAMRLENLDLRRDLSALNRFGAAYLFSLPEIAARLLTTSTDLFDDAAGRSAPAVHVAMIGWDDTAVAVAERVFRMMWSPQFGPPRVTVFTPNAEQAETAFKLRFPMAFGGVGAPENREPVWMADIKFVEFDWRQIANPWTPIREAEEYRGAISSIIISNQTDDETRKCAIRMASLAYAGDPKLYVRDDTESTNREILNTKTQRRIQLFGEQSNVLSPDALVDRSLDEAARRTHDDYVESYVLQKYESDYESALRQGSGWGQRLRRLFSRAPKTEDVKELEADYRHTFGEKKLDALRAKITGDVLKSGSFNPETPAQRVWETLGEQYVESNRAAADHAIQKIRSFGWRPAEKHERGSLPIISETEVTNPIAEIEHYRWCTDRILSGWRYGPARNDAELTHPDLVTYEHMQSTRTPDDFQRTVKKDRDNWVNAPRVATITFPAGFVRVDG